VVKKSLALVGTAVVLGALGYFGHRLLWPSQEDRLRATIDETARIATTPPQEGDLPRLARIQRLRNYLIEDLLVEVEDGPVLGGREAIMGALAQASAAGAVQVRFADVSVTITGQEREAAVTATIEIEQANPRAGSASLDAREVEMRWVRPDAAWLLQRAKVIRPLK
jgi:hypothetical protein